MLVGLAGGCGSRQETLPASPPPAPTPAAAPAAQPASATAAPASAVAPPVAPNVASAPPPAPPPRLAPPQRLEIPAIGVDAGLEYLGLTPDGAMDAPKDPDKVGWYKDGTRPGEPGNALIDGHVDWGQKIRVFWPLKNLKQGDSVVVTDADGKKHEFVVQWSKWYDANAPVNDVFENTKDPEVTLITCGGEFDHTTRQYLSRLVVRAKAK